MGKLKDDDATTLRLPTWLEVLGQAMADRGFVSVGNRLFLNMSLVVYARKVLTPSFSLSENSTLNPLPCTYTSLGSH